MTDPEPPFHDEETSATEGDATLAERSPHFRRHERRPFVLPAMLRDRSGGWSWRAKVVDLSLGGAGIELPERVDTGQLVVVEIVAPSLWDPLVLRGTVVWSRTGRLGVRFDADDPPLLVALFEVLTSNAYE